MISKDGHRNIEAMKWLKADPGNHFGHQVSNKQSLALVESLYIMGAAEVIAFEICHDGNAEFTDKMIIILPQDQMLREVIFDWYNSRIKEMEWATIEDQNQFYLFLKMFECGK